MRVFAYHFVCVIFAAPLILSLPSVCFEPRSHGNLLSLCCKGQGRFAAYYALIYYYDMKGSSSISTPPVVRNEEWDRVLEMAGYNVVHLRDKRYDCVLHLVTAAIGMFNMYGTNRYIITSRTLVCSICTNQTSSSSLHARPGMAIAGAEAHYTLDNNLTRLETIKEAQALDERLQVRY